jgi:hypothetical protein
MTALDLLTKYFEYDYLWRMPDRINDPPSVIRKAQLEALLDAFGLSKDHADPSVEITYTGSEGRETRQQRLERISHLEYFEQGEFLSDRPLQGNRKLINQVLKFVREEYGFEPKSEEERHIHLKWLFSNLMGFRKEAYQLAYPSGGMLEGFSPGLMYSLHLQGKVKTAINEHLGEIDHTLWRVLDPEKRTVEMETLKAEYHYPDVDLGKIDLDWRMENY